MMKYLLFASHLLFISLFLSACQKDDALNISSANEHLEKAETKKLFFSKGGLMIKTEKDQYTAEEKITLYFKNDLDTRVSYGLEYEVQKRIEGVWIDYSLKNPIFTQEKYNLPPNSVASQSLLLNNLTVKELTPGNYRIVKKFDDYYLAAPFEMIE